MSLQELLSELSLSLLKRTMPGDNPEITSLSYDSRSVVTGSLFFAIKGLVTDGHHFIDEALQRGAVAIASEEPPREQVPVPWLTVRSIRRFMAHTANYFFGHPSRELSLAGITGTNGKTTTAYMLNNVLQQRMNTVLMGTIKTSIAGDEIESRLTTPESIDIQRTLRDAVKQGCRSGVMEVSSHALHFERVYGCHFPVVIFTNLSQDHLDFHHDLETYFQTKLRLFQRQTNPGLHHVIVNLDDPMGKRILDSIEADIVSFGLTKDADVQATDFQASSSGIEVDAQVLGERLHLSSPQIGRHNVYNLLATVAAATVFGISKEDIQNGLTLLPQIPGRFERVDIEAPFTVVIDYAHTPDALSNALKLARTVAERRVICVFGAGGNRDRGKRPKMGDIAVQNADLSIITSDNPRKEDPDAIVQDIVEGIGKEFRNYEVIVDRREAIKRACEIARSQDLVLLAGKGHETYQEINGKRLPFDERLIVKEILWSH